MRGFRGLNLVADPESANDYNRRYRLLLPGAIDLLNVAFTTEGQVTQRYGYADFKSSSAANRYITLCSFVTEAGTSYLLAGRTNACDVLDSGGSVAYTQAMTSDASETVFARYGAPGVQRVYFIKNVDYTLRYFDSSGVFGTAGGSPPGAVLVGVQPRENRLALANIVTYTSRVWFSDAGNPDSWPATNYVDLSPGDGESIKAIVAWRELLFVFKPSKIFVFYGNSTDSTGQPVFNYRTIDARRGVDNARAVVAGEDGVYFANSRGIYVTTGSSPQLISQPLDPFFVGNISAFWQRGTVSSTPDFAMAYVNRVLYATMTSNIGRCTFVLDQGTWSCWDLPVNHMVDHKISGVVAPYFAYSTGNNRIGKYSSASTTDAGSSITSRYRSGFFSPTWDSAQSVVREVLLSGIGTVAVKGSTDFGSLSAATNVTLGTSPATAYGRYRIAQRGATHSFEVASVAGGAWTMTGGNLMVRESRPPGMGL